jgi:hypothetical protein
MTGRERSILSDEMRRVREQIEADLLAVSNVDFVSVAFKQEDDRRILVTIGTQRPDLVQVLLGDVLATVGRALHAHLAEGRWQPDFQILKGRVRAQL